MIQERAKQERRRYRRRAFKTASIFCNSRAYPRGTTPYNVSTHLVDICLGGVCVVTVGKLRPGVEMDIRVDLPDGVGQVRAIGTVRWSRHVLHMGRPVLLAGIQFDMTTRYTGDAAKTIQGWEGISMLPAPPRLRDRLERRRHKRSEAFATKVTCFSHEGLARFGWGKNMASELVDLSRSGICLKTCKRLRPGDSYRFRAYLPRLGEEVEARGRVRWSRLAGNGREQFITGLSFDEVDAETRSLLREVERVY